MITITPVAPDEKAGLDGLTDKQRTTMAPGIPHDYRPCPDCLGCLTHHPHHHGSEAGQWLIST